MSIPVLDRLLEKVKKVPDSCWNWTAATDKWGYGCFWYKGKMHGAHRISYQLHNKVELAPEIFILHSCNNPGCVNPAHLREGNHIENMKDVMTGKRRPGQVLDVIECWQLRQQGWTLGAIGKKFNVTAQAVQQILKRAYG